MSVPTAVSRPSAVKTAVILWYTFVGLAVLSLIITVVTNDSPRSVASLGALVLALVAGCTNKFREGANWARIVLTVFGALNIVANVGSLAMLLSSGGVSEVPASALILSTLLPIVVIAALAFSYRREANEFFAAVKASHA
ncbi:hypothetical protein [Actinomycetospora termitidis]|uniref:Transmembrane protein n=1 Tax=Actinomycetospora termitidis TaxID=3053470 RepID=A0ABT7ME49_9PSEU|nr:hypothetical protein [Actinomycetospora sp. Odt1-22]MDL5158940.1 hypothetical protein [Actinomycetospora sp. Odt1-22]